MTLQLRHQLVYVQGLVLPYENEEVSYFLEGPQVAVRHLAPQTSVVCHAAQLVSLAVVNEHWDADFGEVVGGRVEGAVFSEVHFGPVVEFPQSVFVSLN